MTIDGLIKIGIKKLNDSTSPALDGEVLLSYVLNQPKEYLIANSKKKVDSKAEKQYLKLINKRVLGWPVAYLTKTKEFMGLKFYVDKNVLIPRPETEGLVELILSQMTDDGSPVKILDIGTGSGNIIISLAAALRNAELDSASQKKDPEINSGLHYTQFFASDISPKAIAVAKKNAKLRKAKITFKQGSLLNPWKNQHFDIIVANLPYLRKQTDPSIKFEPKGALVAAKKGLALYEKLFRSIARSRNFHQRINLGDDEAISLRDRHATAQVNALVKKQSLAMCKDNFLSLIFLEIGHDQGPAIKKLAKKILPAYQIKIFKDLWGRSRYVMLALKR